MALYRRYQHWGPQGLQWTRWYEVPADTPRNPWEMKNKLKAEFKEE